MKLRTGTDDEPLKRSEADELQAHALEENPELKAKDFTCSTCPLLCWCEFAYDSYNTHGDCLATK